jgi:hypothetical protein
MYGIKSEIDPTSDAPIAVFDGKIFLFFFKIISFILECDIHISINQKKMN